MATSGKVGGREEEDGEIEREAEIKFRCAAIVGSSQICMAQHGVKRAFLLTSDLQHLGEHYPLLKTTTTTKASCYPVSG